VRNFMSDESTTGAAYLAALKKSTPQAAATAAAPARSSSSDNLTLSSAATPDANSKPGEKRRSPRYRCQGSARLRELGSGVSTWSTFTDISLHGCYMEAMSTFRVGAKLALTMEVNGFHVETKSEVRVVYPNLGMGICFTVMSEPNREQLQELLRSLSRPSAILGVRPEVNAALIPDPQRNSAIANPAAALQALITYFDERLILNREEFLRILRKCESSEK
jgi:PilZ domain-containing protein